jgi:23S rRNA (cytidine1920-2'-O)/16S rRNA (cytidine1409-2'-O)-methyltransferase
MKLRLDKLLILQNFASTRQNAQDMIEAGKVHVNGLPAVKAGSLYDKNCKIEIHENDPSYVSRGGYKLAHGLDHFNIDPFDFVCADIGASTGGFTDCLLQRGAKKVFAVDVGYGQLAWKLRQDARVVVMERTNARLLKPGDIGDVLDFIVIDSSFISLKLLIPPLLVFFREKVSILALIKPQFEVGKGKVGKRGVVTDPLLHQGVIDDVVEFGRSVGLGSQGIVESPILGTKGNREFLIHLIS